MTMKPIIELGWDIETINEEVGLFANPPDVGVTSARCGVLPPPTRPPIGGGGPQGKTCDETR